jgi:hypothetical protein
MIVIGLLLVVVAVAVGADLVGQNRVENVQFHAVGHLFAASPGGLIGLGAACGLFGALGIMLLHDGAAQRQRATVRAGTISGEGNSRVADLRQAPVEEPAETASVPS